MLTKSEVDSAQPSRWIAVWVAEAVRATEEFGPLDDREVLARVQQSQGSPAAKLLERAWLLGQRLGMPAQIQRWRDVGWVLLLFAAAGVLALANGLIFSVLADGRTINAASAFVAALGLHAVSLLVWLATLVFRRGDACVVGGLSMGRWATALVAHMPFWRGPHSTALVRASLQLLDRNRLAPWVFGLLSHAIWTLGFALMLVGLLFAFAFREYLLTWETTILEPDWFAAFARVTGYVPSLLGVPAQRPTFADGLGVGHWPARKAAWWLMACVALYGFLPRALCTLWCAIVVRRMSARLTLHLADPYYQQLLARVQALEPTQVSDLEQPGSFRDAAPPPALGAFTPGFAVVSFDMAIDTPWPLPALSQRALSTERIAGDMQEQMTLHEKLAHIRPHALLVVCNVAASPDRGTLRFLREVSGFAKEHALLLVQPSEVKDFAESETGRTRWHSWVESSALTDWRVLDDAGAASRWVDANG